MAVIVSLFMCSFVCMAVIVSLFMCSLYFVIIIKLSMKKIRLRIFLFVTPVYIFNIKCTKYKIC
jgi:hypothetical protein